MPLGEWTAENENDLFFLFLSSHSALENVFACGKYIHSLSLVTFNWFPWTITSFQKPSEMSLWSGTLCFFFGYVFRHILWIASASKLRSLTSVLKKLLWREKNICSSTFMYRTFNALCFSLPLLLWHRYECTPCVRMKQNRKWKWKSLHANHLWSIKRHQIVLNN